MPLQLLFLGTGTSAGVPMIGCDCAVCRSSDPKNHRTRPSVLVSYAQTSPRVDRTAANPESAGLSPHADDVPAADASLSEHPVRRFLIDTTPELRFQMLEHDIRRIDGVWYTHAHADHLFGLDDLRRFNTVMRCSLDIYGEEPTLETIRQTFWYIFEPTKNVNQTFVAQLVCNPIGVGQGIHLYGATWTPLRLMHGHLPILGYLIEYPSLADASKPLRLAYCTDVSHFPSETLEQLGDLDVLVIDALRHRPHKTHQTIDQALAVVGRLKPKQAYFTHIAHDIAHQELQPKLPAGVWLAYDGLKVDLA